MPREFVDLSIYLENDVLSDPPMLAPKIEYQQHADTMREFNTLLPGTTPDDFPDGEAAAAEWVRLTTHSGTHLDAPWHFHSTMDGKQEGGSKPSITIDQVPLRWCFQPGVKLDFRHFADGYVATAADVQAELARIGHVLKPLEIVVVNTRAGSRYGRNDYVDSGCGMGYEATMYLLELPPRQAAQPGSAAGRRLSHQLLSAQDPRCVGRLDARGGDLRRRLSALSGCA